MNESDEDLKEIEAGIREIAAAAAATALVAGRLAQDKRVELVKGMERIVGVLRDTADSIEKSVKELKAVQEPS